MSDAPLVDEPTDRPLTDAQLRVGLGGLLGEMGRIEECVAQFQIAMLSEPGDPASHSNLLFALNYRAHDRAEVLALCREWSARHSLPQLPPVRYRHAKPRIGYVSTDLREGAVARFLLPLLRHHDRDRFEVFLYSVSAGAAVEDAVTATLRSL